MSMGELIVVMGVSGCGKSTVGEKLSQVLAANFLEGDDYHPPENVEKMSRGTPLTNADRALWLDQILSAVNASSAPVIILSCSALTSYVQKRLLEGTQRSIRWIWLSAPQAVIAARLAKRSDHFMPPELLNSQFAALSPPKDAIKIDISGSVEAAMEAIVERLSSRS